MVYDEVLQLAINTNVAPTTASQEQRQNEIRQQRQKREAEALLSAQKTQKRAASKGPAPSSSVALPLPLLKGDSNAPWPSPVPTPAPRAQSASSHSFRREESKPESAASNSNNNSKAFVEGHSKSLTAVTELSPPSTTINIVVQSKVIPQLDPIRGKEIEVAALTANNNPNGSAAALKRPVPVPPPPRDETTVADERSATEKKRRQRLEEQMAKHRRRMELGPRVSVFQLREASAYVNEGIIPSLVQQYPQQTAELVSQNNKPQQDQSTDVNLSLQGLLFQAQSSRSKIIPPLDGTRTAAAIANLAHQSQPHGLSAPNSLQKMNVIGRHVALPSASTIRNEGEKIVLSEEDEDEDNNYDDDGDDDDDERYRYRGYGGPTAEEKRVLRRFYALRRSMQCEEEEEE
eukprot:GDKJ01047930.1.p1 GENE.GDKJ01047930.1~~GDKJ01047930.1.p1  ORF type:complete len:404 (-),score=43.62 GDKJ01047930.1:77-1288(-)